MKNLNSGKCRCEKVTFSLQLPNSLERYSPAKCDCDFCEERNAVYLSHPAGSLNINSSDPLDVIRHGSRQAEFLCCANCGTLVSVVYQFQNRLKGAVNASLLNEFEQLKTPISVSPRLLDPKEKLSRWESVWLSVNINGKNHL